MLPEPLHPAIVHFPVAFALLQPLFMVIAGVVIARKDLPETLWWVIIVLQIVVVGGTSAAEQTGEQEAERVAKIVGKEFVDLHEERAQVFQFLAIATLAASAVGLFSKKLGWGGRGLALVLAIATAVAVVQVGSTGGDLIYEHGGARAYWNK